MIQKKRINNDVFVRWGIFTPEGLPVDLTEVTSITIEARPQSSNGRYPMVSEVVDNFVEAYFLAKDQKVVGKYNLYLTYTIDDPNIIGGVATYTIDYCDAFELLPKSCFVDGEDDVDPVNIQGIIASFTYSMLTEEEKNDLASRLSGNSGAQNLSDLLDVTISNLEIDQILKYDGTKWVNAASTGDSSSNVSWGIPTSQYTPLTVNGVTRNLSLNNHTHPWDTITNRPLTDEQFQDLLEITGLWKLDNDGNLYTERNVYSHGEISAYNWGESPTPPVGVYNLKELLDVGIINPQEDNILRFNGSHWVNVPSSNVGTLVEWSSETDNYVNLLVGDSSKSISLHGHKHEIEDINNLQDSLDFKQDSIPLGDISQYYRGDKEWATLNTDTVVESNNLYYTPERVIGLTGDLYAQKDHTHAFGSLTGLPNTLDGYGIIDAYNKTEIDNLISSTSGFWVKSVGLEAPTGFTVSNSPIIYEGNIKLSFASGYSLPSNSKQYNWDLAFSDRHTHTNISVLNELTIDDVNNWNSIQEHLNDYDNPHQVSFKQLIKKPSTLLGYGITDVYNKTEVDYIFSNITPGESIIKNVYGYDSIDQSFSDSTITDTFNAYTISRLHDRLTILEQGDTNLDTIINWYNNIGRYWLLDPNNDALYTNKNVYSTKEVSAYGLGTGGSGTDYERLDTWADYDSTKSGWVLSAFLGNDLNTRVTDLENSAGSGSVTSVGISVPTGLSVSNSPITSSGVIEIGLQTGYSIPTTVKQDNWDIAFTNNHTHSNKGVLDGITSALVSNWNTAYTNSHTHSNKAILDEITSTNITNWNTAFTNSHTHSNKAVIDQLTQDNINVLAKLTLIDGVLQIDADTYSTGELSAYGLGSGGGSGGGIIETVYGYSNLGQTFNNANLTDTFNAYTINQINTRLVSVESGSATTVNTTGTGNAITSISKSGTVITADKGLTFSLSNHLHSASDITSGTFAIARIPTGTSSSTVALGNHLHTGVYEPVFTKNNAFNKNFGTVAGTVAQGNHTHSYLPLSGGDIKRTFAGWPNAIDSNASNYINQRIFGVSTNQNTLSFFGDGNQNARRFGIQSGHESPAYASAFGILELNPFGGVVRINGTTAATVNSNVASATKLASIPTTFTGTYPVTVNVNGTIYSHTGLTFAGSTGTLTANTFAGNATTATTATNLNRSIIAGNGLSGGGVMTADRTITLGTPSNITLSSTNSVTTSSHTHNFTLGGTASQYLNGATTLVTIPTVTAGNGLTGGGQLTSGRTLTLGTPSTLTAATTNGVTASSHTHAITTTSVGAANTIIQTDATGGTKLNNLMVGGAWKLEQVGTELQLKYNNVVAQRFLLDGSIVGLGEITACGATTGGEGVALLRTGGTMTGNLTMSADIIMNSGRAIGKSNLPLKLLGNALTYNASNVLTEANTATKIKMGNGWTIEQTTASLTIRKNGVIKGTFNA